MTDDSANCTHTRQPVTYLRPPRPAACLPAHLRKPRPTHSPHPQHRQTTTKGLKHMSCWVSQTVVGRCSVGPLHAQQGHAQQGHAQQGMEVARLRSAAQNGSAPLCPRCRRMQQALALRPCAWALPQHDVHTPYQTASCTVSASRMANLERFSLRRLACSAPGSPRRTLRMPW